MRILKIMSLLAIAIGFWCFLNIIQIEQAKMYSESVGTWGRFASFSLIVFGVVGYFKSKKR